MDSLFFEHREYYVTRLQQIDASTKSSQPLEDPEISNDALDVAVCVRIRPLSEQEGFDGHVCGVTGQQGGIVDINEPRKKINGKPDLNTTTFTLDQVFDSRKSSQDIYDDKVEHLVQWVFRGGTSMLLAYGQTGSGKTFTVSALEKLVVQRLVDEVLPVSREIHMCIFEIFGNNAYDLLNDRKQISVMEDSLGTMQVVGAIEKSSNNGPELLQLIDTAKSLRQTESTAKNDHSSRSHAICRIRLADKESAGLPEGTFFLVDLAGSEAGADTKHHSAQRLVETREINKSLATLKDCIRARAQWAISRASSTQKHVHIPFRHSKLTQVLKRAFDVVTSETCRTLVVACVAPSVLDVSQSRNTLRYAEMLRVPVPKMKPRPYDGRIPTTWSNKEVQAWIRKNSGTPPVNPLWLASHENGVQLCRLQQDEFIARALRTAGVKSEQAKALYFKLWTLHIDSRALLMRSSTTTTASNSSSNDLGAMAPVQAESGTASPLKRIAPGSFFRLGAPEHDNENAEIVMVMGLEDSKEKSERAFVCAAVRLADAMQGRYELLVARQRVLKRNELRDEVGMEYDCLTRYYHIKTLDKQPGSATLDQIDL